jgi:NTE family protein
MSSPPYQDNSPQEQPEKNLTAQPSPEKWNLTTKLAKTLNDLSSPAMDQARKWMYPDPVPSIFDVVTASTSIMESRITAIRLAADPPDLLLQPRVGQIRSLEFHRAKEAIAAGHQEAVTRLESYFRR